MPTLSDPLRLPRGAILPNRLAKAATQEALGTLGNEATPQLARLYGRWSRGGAGLLLTGNVMVDRAHLGRPRDVALDDATAAGPLRAWATEARAGGSAAWVQLNHAGRQTPTLVTRHPLGPSDGEAVRMFGGGYGRPRAMTLDEIAATTRAFARAAALCHQTGWDGVQIHAAHGYLLSQFLSPLVNRRTDAYGGSVEGRVRLLLEIVRAVKAEVPESFAVSVKVNSADFQRGGFEPADFRAVARMLDAEGIDLLEISGGSYESFAMFEGPKTERTKAREAYFLEFAREVRGEVKVPLMLTGGFRSRAAMESALGEGVDVVGLARALIVEPELPRALLAGTAAAARELPRRRAPRRLAAPADAAWHWAQLARMGEGKHPDPTMGTWRALLGYLGYDLVASMRRGRSAGPARLGAGASV